MAEPESPRGPEVNGGQVRLERIYLKDASFESPRVPEIYGERAQPDFQLDINTKTRGLADGRVEVELAVTLHARTDGNRTAYIAEVRQAGVFHIAGFDAQTMHRILGTFCPGTLFPYVREAVDSLVVRGGFPPVHLAPVNFEALFAEAVRKQATPAVAH
jgi:preprotein translocase subunit SecB